MYMYLIARFHVSKTSASLKRCRLSQMKISKAFASGSRLGLVVIRGKHSLNVTLKFHWSATFPCW